MRPSHAVELSVKNQLFQLDGKLYQQVRWRCCNGITTWSSHGKHFHVFDWTETRWQPQYALVLPTFCWWHHYHPTASNISKKFSWHLKQLPPIIEFQNGIRNQTLNRYISLRQDAMVLKLSLRCTGIGNFINLPVCSSIKKLPPHFLLFSISLGFLILIQGSKLKIQDPIFF